MKAKREACVVMKGQVKEQSHQKTKGQTSKQ